MRDFILDDYYALWELLDAAGYDDSSFEGVLQMAAANKGDITRVGIKAISKVLHAFAEKGAREPMLKFLSGPFEVSPEEMGKMPMKDMVDGIKWLIQEGFLQDFLRQLSE